MKPIYVIITLIILAGAGVLPMLISGGYDLGKDAIDKCGQIQQPQQRR